MLRSPVRSTRRSPAYGPVDGAFGAVVAVPALQVVGNRGEIHLGQAGARGSTNNLQVARTRHYLGSQATSELRLAFQDYYINATPAGEIAGNGYTARFNIEYNDLSVQGTFGGERDGVIAAGDAIVISDPILPAAFGLSEFPANAQIWIRAEREYAVGAVSQFHRTTAFPTITITGERYMSAAAGTASKLDLTGALVADGGWTAQTHVWVPLAILGRPVAPMMAVAGCGASIEMGVADDDGDGSTTSGGYLRQACFDLDGAGLKIARMNLARSSETAAHFVDNNAKRLAILPYITHAFIGYGGGDYTAGSTLAATLTRQATSWAHLKGQGVPFVAQVSMSPKTNSTDSWATVANQTPRTGWAIGAEWYEANATLEAAIDTDANLDGFLDLWPTQVDGTATDKWKAASTSDGTHPNGTMSVSMATAAKTYLSTLRTAYEG